MKKGDNNLINFTNRVNVLNVLWKEPSIYRAEIARCTNLSIPTVMKIVDDLSGRGIVRETCKGVSSGGKPPMMLELNKDAYYIIGVDINKYWTEVVLVNLLLGIEEKRIQDIRTTDQVDSVIKRIIREIEMILEDHPDKRDRILGIGIGIPGLVNPQTGYISYSAEMNWRDVRMKEIFQKHFDGEIIIEERTRAKAAAEKRIGWAREVENFLYVTIGSGIGSAINLNGRLYYGHNESAGRIGHMVVERNGLLCECGNHGCLENYASGKAITRMAKERLLSTKETLIYDLVFGNPERIDEYTVFEAAQNGDHVAIEILQEAAEYLAMAISSVINFIDPQMIVFGGKVCRTGSIYMELFRKAWRERYSGYAGENIQIIVTQRDSNTASIGAAAFLLERFLARGGEHKQLLERLKE